jgi:hypothetical protein
MQLAGSNLDREINWMILIRFKGSFTIIAVLPLIIQVSFAGRCVSILRPNSLSFGIKASTENATFFSHNRS